MGAVVIFRSAFFFCLTPLHTYQFELLLYLLMLKAVLFVSIGFIFKVFIESVTILLMVYDSVFLAARRVGFQCPTRKEPAPPASEGEVLITGPPREVPKIFLTNDFY